jgi:hypothetical protein
MEVARTPYSCNQTSQIEMRKQLFVTLLCNNNSSLNFCRKKTNHENPLKCNIDTRIEHNLKYHFY